jgi:hypothetical protein
VSARHHSLGHAEEARKAYERAVRLLAGGVPDPDLQHPKAEAEALLGITKDGKSR